MEPDWNEALVVFHDGDADAMSAGADRAERHRIRKRATDQHRSELIHLLAKAGLDKEVELPSATPLSSLMVKGSPRALAEIDRSPSVKELLPVSDAASLEILSDDAS